MTAAELLEEVRALCVRSTSRPKAPVLGPGWYENQDGTVSRYELIGGRVRRTAAVRDWPMVLELIERETALYEAWQAEKIAEMIAAGEA